MPEKYIVNTVVDAVVVGGSPGQRVLDLSCGEGDVIAALAEKGFEVEGTHFKEDDYIIRNPNPILKTARIHTGVDLGGTLPFEDGSYDVVLATEVIEHLADHPTFLREAGRILKPGGRLVLSTPNVHRLKSRLTFFWTGRHDLLGGRLGWETAPENLYSTHHHPVDFSILHTMLFQNGVRIEGLRITRINPVSMLLYPLVPLVSIFAWISTRRVVRDHRDGGTDLRRWLRHPALLLSDQLLLIAQKG